MDHRALVDEWVPKTAAEWNRCVDLIINERYAIAPPVVIIMWTSLFNCPDYDQLRVSGNIIRNVHIVVPQFQCYHFGKTLTSINRALRKNDVVRNILEIRGDDCKETGHTEKALRCYALALAFAPNQLSKIYVKRAAVFASLKKYDLALMDIDRALHDNESQSTVSRTPLLEQKKIYEASIVPEIQSEEDMNRKVFRDQIISKVHSENSPTALPDFVSVEYHPVKGRYLVTNVDLEPGSVVLVEDHYVCATANCLKFQTKCCDRCLKTILNPIPCENCVMSVYCGEECRAEDQKNGHKYECPILAYLHCTTITQSYYLSFKAICRSGSQVLKELWIKSKSCDYLHHAWFVPPNATHENQDPYSQILNLKHHSNNEENERSTWTAVSLAYALRLKTTFFDIIDESDKLEFEKFIAIIIIHHSQSFPYNSMDLGSSNFKVKDLSTYLLTAETGTATGIFSVSNLMNHSCSPTTFLQSMAGGRIALITNQTLKAGDELTRSYGFNHLSLPLQQRQKELLEQFRISCDCYACKENWPTSKDMYDSGPSRFVCKRCKSRIRANRGLLAKLSIKEIDPELLKCCDSAASRSHSSKDCDPLSYILEIARKLVLKNKPLEALPLITECIKYYQTDPYKPSVQLILAQDRLMDCFTKILR